MRKNRNKNKKDSEIFDSVLMNKDTYTQYVNRLTELAVCMFEWKNLPPTVDERYLELCLFEKGYAVFFKDEEIGELALKCAIRGDLDVYGYPKNRRAYANNGYQKDLTEQDSVLIYNNYIRTPSQLDVYMFARRLSMLDRTIDINTLAQRTPIIITCDEQQRLTYENLLKDYQGGTPILFGSRDLDVKGVNALKTDAPFNADKLYQLKTQYWNEALTYLGISNINIQKKERLVSNEVTRNQGGTIASRYSRLESRRIAVEKINKLFGLEIEVNYREDFQFLDSDIISDTLGDDISGGVDDE